MVRWHTLAVFLALMVAGCSNSKIEFGEKTSPMTGPPVGMGVGGAKARGTSTSGMNK